MTITRAEIVDEVRYEMGYTVRKTINIVETLMEIIKETLESGEDVLISGFGKFCVNEKLPRKGRNPATGENMMLDKRRVVTFRCSKVLRQKINGG